MPDRLPTLGTHVVRQNSVKDTIAARSATSRTPNGKSESALKKLVPGAKGKPNGSILNFFKREEQGLFVHDATVNKENGLEESEIGVRNEDDLHSSPSRSPTGQSEVEQGSRYNESGIPIKRQKLDDTEQQNDATPQGSPALRECTPPPPECLGEVESADTERGRLPDAASQQVHRRPTGPFLDESDDDMEDFPTSTRRPPAKARAPINGAQPDDVPTTASADGEDGTITTPKVALTLMREATSYSIGGDFEDFEGMADFDDEFAMDGEEYRERRFYAEQRRLGLADAGFEGDIGGFDDFFDVSPEVEKSSLGQPETAVDSVASCPICNISLAGVSNADASVHVNNCLDGKPSPLPKQETTPAEPEVKTEKAVPRFAKTVRPPKPGQENPIVLGGAPGTAPTSAFSRLMSGHAEDAAWATAAAAEHSSRGKPAFQRTCPFYKIMPGMLICVDAFRYGGVKDCRAYFLSHFHSDHYIGLTSTWSHGPIYGSRVTNNLVRQQLRVDPKFVIDLEFETKTEIPGTPGVFVTMIPANHCPGSSLYLFEKLVGRGNPPKIQRILHCGDFRACRMHVEHPLLQPDVIDSLTGQTRQQKIDICYLDTTYLNPKYAFPSQEEVIKACGDMCVSLNKIRADGSDGWETMKRERAGAGMVKFVQKEPSIKQEDDGEGEEAPEPSMLDAMSIPTGSTKSRGRLLVVVGTYSIGKERICMGIAKALDSKIYAPTSKRRICACLEDQELTSRLTDNPREAQVHMTPLFEIRADTLDDYLKDYRDTFSRAVGFRPTGWNYRPPNSRFVESPAVATVLRGSNWKSTFSMKELVPQRGSTSRASCFGVPYSEHSSFRELTMFVCALRIEKVVPTVNVGSARSREKMRSWVERWMTERRKHGLFKLDVEGNEW